MDGWEHASVWRMCECVSGAEKGKRESIKKLIVKYKSANTFRCTYSRNYAAICFIVVSSKRNDL